MNRIILHIDFDYFYAQCEEIRGHGLKTKPVCVCVFSDRGTDTGAIATANYIARKFGVKSGISISAAKKRLEGHDAVFLPVDFDYYDNMSQNAMTLIQQHADIFEYVGRDEAYLDVSQSTEFSFKRAAHLAQQIKNELRTNIGLCSSIGISPNKLLSKIASDYQKPDGLTIVTPAIVRSFLDPLTIRKIPGIGRKTESLLAGMNLKTIKDLSRISVFELYKQLGRKTGTYIYNAAKGIDDEPVKPRAPRIQYSKITTLKSDTVDYDTLCDVMSDICDKLYQIILDNSKVFKAIGIHFIQSDMTSRTKSKTLKNPTCSKSELKRAADDLLKAALVDQKTPIRRLGVRISDLSDAAGQQDITRYF